MKVLFRNTTAEQQFSSKYRKKWRYPKQVITKLLAAENYIQNADSLFDIATYPPFHFHGLEGNRKEEWSIYLGHTGYRIIIIPCDDSGNEIVCGDIMAQCKAIRIIKVTEVTNHYE